MKHLTETYKKIVTESDDTEAMQKWVEDNKDNWGKSASEALDQANDQFEGYGVEVVRDSNEWDNYFGDIVAEYVNMGDTYITTIIYDVIEKEFVVMSWGDWMEERERKLTINLDNDDDPKDIDVGKFVVIDGKTYKCTDWMGDNYSWELYDENEDKYYIYTASDDSLEPKIDEPEEKDYDYFMNKDEIDQELIEWLAKEFHLRVDTVSQMADMSNDPEELYNTVDSATDEMGFGFDSIEESVNEEYDSTEDDDIYFRKHLRGVNPEHLKDRKHRNRLINRTLDSAKKHWKLGDGKGRYPRGKYRKAINRVLGEMLSEANNYKYETSEDVWSFIFKIQDNINTMINVAKDLDVFVAMSEYKDAGLNMRQYGDILRTRIAKKLYKMNNIMGNINEANKYNNPNYKYYVVKNNKIETGWEYREDAIDYADEMGGRVLSKKFVTSKGLNPEDNSSWFSKK